MHISVFNTDTELCSCLEPMLASKFQRNRGLGGWASPERSLEASGSSVALPDRSGKVARGFARFPVSLWEVQERQGEVEHPPGPPLDPSPGSLQGGQQGGSAPTTTRGEIEAKAAKRKQERKTQAETGAKPRIPSHTPTGRRIHIIHWKN